jgi:hypothetical protein
MLVHGGHIVHYHMPALYAGDDASIQVYLILRVCISQFLSDSFRVKAVTLTFVIAAEFAHFQHTRLSDSRVQLGGRNK